MCDGVEQVLRSHIIVNQLLHPVYSHDIDLLQTLPIRPDARQKHQTVSAAVRQLRRIRNQDQQIRLRSQHHPQRRFSRTSRFKSTEFQKIPAVIRRGINPLLWQDQTQRIPGAVSELLLQRQAIHPDSRTHVPFIHGWPKQHKREQHQSGRLGRKPRNAEVIGKRVPKLNRMCFADRSSPPEEAIHGRDTKHQSIFRPQGGPDGRHNHGRLPHLLDAVLRRQHHRPLLRTLHSWYSHHNLHLVRIHQQRNEPHHIQRIQSRLPAGFQAHSQQMSLLAMSSRPLAVEHRRRLQQQQRRRRRRSWRMSRLERETIGSQRKSFATGQYQLLLHPDSDSNADVDHRPLTIHHGCYDVISGKLFMMFILSDLPFYNETLGAYGLGNYRLRRIRIHWNNTLYHVSNGLRFWIPISIHKTYTIIIKWDWVKYIWKLIVLLQFQQIVFFSEWIHKHLFPLQTNY